MGFRANLFACRMNSLDAVLPQVSTYKALNLTESLLNSDYLSHREF